MKRPIHKYIPYIVKVAEGGRKGPIWDVFNLFPDGSGSPFRDKNYAGDIDRSSSSSSESSSNSSDSSNPNTVPISNSRSSYIIPSIPYSGSSGGSSTFSLKVPGGPEISFGPHGPSISGGTGFGGFPGMFPAGTRVTQVGSKANPKPSNNASSPKLYTEEDLKRRKEEIDKKISEDRKSRDYADSLINGAIADRERNARAWKWYRGLHGLGITGGGIAGYNLGRAVNHIAGLDDSNKRSWNGFLANLAIKGLGTGAGALAGHLLTKRFLQPKDLSNEDVVYKA